MKKKGCSPIHKSFQFAFRGIWDTFRSERNFRIQLVVALIVVALGIVLDISITEWFICLLFISIVISLELVNTALEACVDLVTKEYEPMAKKAKDAAAAAVLVSSIISGICGLVIFIPKLVILLKL